MPLRLPLGREAVERISGAYRRGLDEVERWAETARGADLPESMTITEVADLLDTSPHTLRHYERPGWSPAAARHPLWGAKRTLVRYLEESPRAVSP